MIWLTLTSKVGPSCCRQRKTSRYQSPSDFYRSRLVDIANADQTQTRGGWIIAGTQLRTGKRGSEGIPRAHHLTG